MGFESDPHNVFNMDMHDQEGGSFWVLRSWISICQEYDLVKAGNLPPQAGLADTTVYVGSKDLVAAWAGDQNRPGRKDVQVMVEGPAMLPMDQIA